MEDKEHILVVDVETTGLDPVKCSIIEIGAVALMSGEEFCVDVRMDEGAIWDDEAAEVHGRSFDQCNNPTLPTQVEALTLLLDWTDQFLPEGRLILAGMNPRFDLDFLRAVELPALSPLRRRRAERFSHRTIDMHTLAVADALRIEPNFHLGTLYTDGIYEFLQMDREPKPHRALTGARMEAQAIRELLDL